QPQWLLRKADDAWTTQRVYPSAACTLASWVDALGRRDRGESGFHRCRDPERHRDGPPPTVALSAAVPRSGRGAPRNSSRLATRSCGMGRSALDAGSVVRVTDGFFVTVK